MNQQEWMNNPKLSGIDPQKMQILMSLANESKNKKQNEILPFLMAVMTQTKSKGITFSQSEADLIIEVLKAGKSKEEINKIEQIISLMKLQK